MRVITRTAAALALAVPALIGLCGPAAADGDLGGLDASWGTGQFVANESGTGMGGTQSSVSPDGVSHTDFFVWSDDTGVAGAFSGGGASWSNG
ncbi:hypothetical protein ABZ990_07900 [Streptomyces sp. NPDC046203]|uniref:hypothetical protein n=1 Tax=Streptomyces sp. NPDC046203 TaxID=3154602 RepID=UPI0034027378